MRQPSDRELVRASQRGSTEAFGALVRQHEERVYAVAFGILLDHRDAQDAAQEAFLRAWEKLETLRRAESFPAWLARVAHTCAADIRRRRPRDLVMDVHAEFSERPERTVGQEEYAVRDDLDRLVEAGMRSLPETLRVALTMRYIGQQTYADIAEGLSVTPGAAYRRVSTARRRLRAYYERAGSELDCLDALYSRWLVSPAGLVVAGPVLERIEPRPEPHAYAALVDSRLLLSALMGGVTTLVGMALLYGFALAGDAGVHVGAPAGIPATTFTVPRPDIEDAVFHPAGPARTLLRPGDKLADWKAWSPGTARDLPQLTTEHYGSPPFGAVFRNTGGVYREFDPAEGEVTFEVWLRPAPPGYDNFVYLMVDKQQGWHRHLGAPWHDAVGIHKHGSSGWWLHGDGARQLDGRYGVPYITEAGWVPFAPVDHDGQRVKIVHRTFEGSYDIYVDGVPMARDVSAPRTRGKPVTGVWMNGFANQAPSPTYFDDLKVSVRPVERWAPGSFADGAAP